MAAKVKADGRITPRRRYAEGILLKALQAANGRPFTTVELDQVLRRNWGEGWSWPLSAYAVLSSLAKRGEVTRLYVDQPGRGVLWSAQRPDSKKEGLHVKVADMEVLPEMAGVAYLHFQQRRNRIGVRSDQTHRDGDRIYLETTPTSRFVALKNGEQFLFAEDDSPRAAFFGGTDERPFLVPLDQKVLAIYSEQGEAGFFESIKPERIRDLEKQFGRSHTKRQGDIFAFPVLAPVPAEDQFLSAYPYEAIPRITALTLPAPGSRLSWWETIELMDARGYPLDPAQSSSRTEVLSQRLSTDGWQRVFGTRHLLHGTSMRFRGHPSLLVAEGTLYNSDHAAVVLDGPHVLGQTEMIAAWQPRYDID